MRVCIFGAGAVGGHFAAKLAAGGCTVSVLARGAQLEAIRTRGIRLLTGGKIVETQVAASDRSLDLGPQDFVISTLKATTLDALARGIGPLLGQDTAVVFAQNGVPWWYGLGKTKPCGRLPDLSWLDPDRAIERAVEPRRIIGGVIFSSNQVVEPGVVFNDSPERNALIVGEIDDAQSERVQRLRELLNTSGVGSPPARDIREVIWSKLVSNMTASILCLLTGLKVTELVADERLAGTLTQLMGEAHAIAAALGYRFPEVGLEAMRSRVPDHKPSILQDFEKGRPMEIDALVRAPQAFARSLCIPTPGLDVVAALAIHRAANTRATLAA